MKRDELEHLIRAAAAITNEYEIMVIGSQSILGSAPHAPDFLLQSMAADIYPLHRPELADLIDGAIGELSPFEECFGYYAQGVGPETAVLPEGWESRLVKIQNANTDLKIGYCLDLMTWQHQNLLPDVTKTGHSSRPCSNTTWLIPKFCNCAQTNCPFRQNTNTACNFGSNLTDPNQRIKNASTRSANLP